MGNKKVSLLKNYLFSIVGACGDFFNLAAVFCCPQGVNK
jgi:hypothetical protein